MIMSDLIRYLASLEEHQVECVCLELSSSGAAGIDPVQTGKKLRQLCLERGFTVRRIQKELHISQQSVYAWFEGRTLPGLDNLYQLCGLLDVPMERILSGTDRQMRIFLQLEKKDRESIVLDIWNYYLRQAGADYE